MVFNKKTLSLGERWVVTKQDSFVLEAEASSV